MEEINYGFLGEAENNYLLNNFEKDFKTLVSFNLIKEKIKKNYDQFAKFVEAKNYFLNNFNDNLSNKLNQYVNYFEKELAIELKNILDNRKKRLTEIRKEIDNLKINASWKVQSKEFEINTLNRVLFSLEQLIDNPNYLNTLIGGIKKFSSLIDKKIKDYKAKKDQKLIWDTAQNLFDKVRKTKTESEESLINDEFFEDLTEEIKNQKCK